MSHKGRSQTTFWHHFGTIGHRGNHGQHGGSRPHQLGQHHSVLSVAWRSFLLLPGAILWNVLGEFLYEVYASYAYDNYVHSLCTIVTIYSTYMNMIECVLVSHSWLFSLLFKALKLQAGEPRSSQTRGWSLCGCGGSHWTKDLAIWNNLGWYLQILGSGHGLHGHQLTRLTPVLTVEFCSEESGLPH